MNKTVYLTLFAYPWSTTRRLLEGADRLGAAARQDDPGYGHGSIHALLFHLLETGMSWRAALETGRQPERREDDPDLPALQAVSNGSSRPGRRCSTAWMRGSSRRASA